MPRAWSMGMLAAAVLVTGCLLETRRRPPTILFLGNSITFAWKDESIGWNHSAGMASSAPSMDYVHRTVRILKENGLEVEPVLGTRDCEVCDGPINSHRETLDDVRALRPRYVVIQLGENSGPEEVASGRLERDYAALLAGLEEIGARRIFCFSNWDEDDLGDPHNRAVVKAMRTSRAARLVDITALAGKRENYGDPALYPNVDVAWHPGDLGMDGMARALARVVLENR